jgi:RNA polymerase sigma factor (TIGR02999 family)
MRKERRDHTLQPTALVNEAYMKLIGHLPDECNDRSHFLGAASRAMRWFLIDYARRRPGGQKVELDTAHLVVGPVQPSVLDVDQALKELEAIAPRQAQLVELHFFGGLSLREAAGVLGMAPRTADNDWKLARAWLARRLSSG